MAAKEKTTLKAQGIRCPEKSGGCGADSGFRAGIGPGPRRGIPKLVLCCQECGHQLPFVLATGMTDLTMGRNGGKETGPLDLSGAEFDLK